MWSDPHKPIEELPIPTVAQLDAARVHADRVVMPMVNRALTTSGLIINEYRWGKNSKLVGFDSRGEIVNNRFI